MRPAIVTGTTPDIPRADKSSRVPDFLKLIEEIKVLKNRLLTNDTSRLDDDFAKQRDSVMKGLDRKVNPRDPRAPDDLLRRQAESLRIVEADHERSKEILNAKYQKLDANLLALTQFLQTLGPMKEFEARLAEKDELLRKQEGELNVQRKVMAHEQDEIGRERRLLDAAEDAFKAKTFEVESKLAQLDVVQRAEALDRMKAELDDKLKVFEQESADLPRQREELNRDLELLGRQRAEMETEQERLRTERLEIDKRRAAMADAVARELASAFESFVRDMLRAPAPPPPARASAPPSPTSAGKPAPAGPPAPARLPGSAGKRVAPAAEPSPKSAKEVPAEDPFHPPGA